MTEMTLYQMFLEKLKELKKKGTFNEDDLNVKLIEYAGLNMPMWDFLERQIGTGARLIHTTPEEFLDYLFDQPSVEDFMFALRQSK